MTTEPFAPGSISMRLYPHNDLPPGAIAAELTGQARLAVEHGFDGVMVSEHHGGFAGYLPNPIQTAGWMLDAMGSGWAAPSPVLVPLRPPALVAEETAWLAARFPGRVGLGLAAGALPSDFELMGASMDGLTDRFTAALADVTAALTGRASGTLAGDPAIRQCAQRPVPILSAAMGRVAARRAAAHGVGLLFDSLSPPERIRQLVDAYRAAGGRGPAVMVRRVWVGPPPRELFDRQVDVYRGYASGAAQAQWSGDQVIAEADGAATAATVAAQVAAGGADAVNIRVHVPGVSPGDAREQIRQLGATVLPPLRDALGR